MTGDEAEARFWEENDDEMANFDDSEFVESGDDNNVYGRPELFIATYHKDW